MNAVPLEAVQLAMTYILSAVTSGQQPQYQAQEAHAHFHTLLVYGLSDDLRASEIFRIASMCGMPQEFIPGG